MELVQEASALISYYYGSRVSANYRKYYGERSDRDVLDSCRRLLADLVGSEKAERLVAPLYPKYHVEGGRE